MRSGAAWVSVCVYVCLRGIVRNFSVRERVRSKRNGAAIAEGVVWVSVCVFKRKREKRV